MSFDKVKAMRSAERYLVQGKIQAAISEYKQVVENDPRDFTTLNMLGDLYVKTSNEKEAVRCFNRVAEHYGRQGFAQKAIAIYNKIARIEPGSVEVCAKLAELYHSKGAVVEAKTHYLKLAEHYQNQGQRLEAVTVWKQIAELDASNTDIYLKIAEVYREEQQAEEAARAFAEAGSRFAARDDHESAVAAFSKSLEIIQNEWNTLNAMVASQLALGFSEDAVKALESFLEAEPGNKEAYYLLADCYLDLNDPAQAEKVITKLLEREPASYPKLLKLTEVYLKNDDLEAAVRILLVTSEQLLAVGNSDELLKWLNEILARNPEQIDALRMLVRVSSWLRDEAELKQALERLAETARLTEEVDDERYALSQLVLIAPHEEQYAARLQEIVERHGYVEVEPISDIGVKAQPTEFAEDVPEFETFSILTSDEEAADEAAVSYFESFENDQFGTIELSSGIPMTDETALSQIEGFEDDAQIFAAFGQTETGIAGSDAEDLQTFPGESADLSPSEAYAMQQELDGVEFYRTQGYAELAEKSLAEIEGKYGRRAEIDAVRERLKLVDAPSPEQTEEVTRDLAFAFDSGTSEKFLPGEDFKNFDIFGDIKSELGLEETDPQNDGDYDTHYHLAIAYREMGLLDEAIKEFQDAVNLVQTSDGTRRFFSCANLLGVCFIEKQMPNLALLWFKRALETEGLNEDEQQALMYEIGNAYELGGDEYKALEYFEKVYGVDIDYRDVSRRLQKLQEKIAG